MKPEGLWAAMLEAIDGLEGPKAYWSANAAALQAYEADPPAGWDLLSPIARIAMIEGSARCAISMMGLG